MRFSSLYPSSLTTRCLINTLQTLFISWNNFYSLEYFLSDIKATFPKNSLPAILHGCLPTGQLQIGSLPWLKEELGCKLAQARASSAALLLLYQPVSGNPPESSLFGYVVNMKIYETRMTKLPKIKVGSKLSVFSVNCQYANFNALNYLVLIKILKIMQLPVN